MEFESGNEHDTPIVKLNLQDAGCFWEMEKDWMG